MKRLIFVLLKILYSLTSVYRTPDETERRLRKIELLQSKSMQLEKLFHEQNITLNQDRTNLLGATAGWESDDDDLASGEGQRLTVDQIRNRHKQMLEDQEKGLDNLSKIISRQKNIAQTINTEVDLQNDIIDDLGDHIDQTDVRVTNETRVIGTIGRKDRTCIYWVIIIVLFICIIVLASIK